MFIRKLVLTGLVILLAAGCASSVDTAKFSPKEYFDYIKKLYDDEDYYDALQNLNTILMQYPGNEITDDAQYLLGMTYYHRKEYILAAYEFSKLIKDIPGSQFVPDAQYMLAESYYQLSPPANLDQTYTKKSIEEFQAFIDFFPTDKRVEDSEKKISEMYGKMAEKEFNSAIIYEKMEYYNAALSAYDYVVKTYHDSQYAKLALLARIRILKSKERYSEAIRDVEIYLDRYPQDSKTKEMEKEKADLLVKIGEK